MVTFLWRRTSPYRLGSERHPSPTICVFFDAFVIFGLMATRHGSASRSLLWSSIRNSRFETPICGAAIATAVKPATLKEHYQSAFKHFQENPSLADSLLAVGELPRDMKLDKTQTAAMTVVANSILNFDETYMKR